MALRSFECREDGRSNSFPEGNCAKFVPSWEGILALRSRRLMGLLLTWRLLPAGREAAARVGWQAS